MEWLAEAQRLPLGHKRRIRHDCSEDKCMLVSHGEAGYNAYCFRCGPVGFEPHGYCNLARLAELQELNSLAQKEYPNVLPSDCITTVPPEYSTWLSKAGINAGRAKLSGILWSPSLQRIVLPVYHEGKLIYWQARAVRKGMSPKYTNPSVPKDSVLYRAGWSSERKIIYVTEDILSALRVGRHCASASILGTKTSDAQANLLAEYAHVVYWLDPDDAGRKGNKAGARKLSLATQASILESEADPKNLTDRRIRELLGLKPNSRYGVF